ETCSRLPSPPPFPSERERIRARRGTGSPPLHSLRPESSAGGLPLFAQTRQVFRRVRVSRSARNLEDQQSLRIEARINMLQFKKAAEHQSRSNQQYNRERPFRHHHDIPKRASPH